MPCRLRPLVRVSKGRAGDTWPRKLLAIRFRKRWQVERSWMRAERAAPSQIGDGWLAAPRCREQEYDQLGLQVGHDRRSGCYQRPGVHLVRPRQRWQGAFRPLTQQADRVRGWSYWQRHREKSWVACGLALAWSHSERRQGHSCGWSATAGRSGAGREPQRQSRCCAADESVTRVADLHKHPHTRQDGRR